MLLLRCQGIKSYHQRDLIRRRIKTVFFHSNIGALVENESSLITHAYESNPLRTFQRHQRKTPL